MPDLDRLAARAGVVGPLVGFAATLTATASSPSFRWFGSALSDLGAPGAATPWLFNGGLVLAGILTLPVAWALWVAAAGRLQRLGAGLAGLTMLALALIGVFPSGDPLHLPVAVTFFVLISVTAWVHGSGTVLAGAPRRGLVAIWLGIGHVLGWLGWLAVGPGGIAVPELAGTLLLYAWLLLEVRAMPFAGVGPDG